MGNHINVSAESNSDTKLTLSQLAIKEYIEEAHHSGALLVTGKWGSGKTFYMKSIRDFYNRSDYCISFTSLFGINTPEELISTVKKDVCSTFADVNTTDDRETTSKLFNGLKTLTGLFKDSNGIASTVNTIININYLDFVELSSVLFQKELVLIFDDLERCSIEMKALLGVINNLCENQGIKVIIIADEDNIKKRRYTDFKEKVVSKTIQLDLEHRSIISALIKEYKAEGSNYQRYLYDNISLIDSLFMQSGYKNLRSIKSVVNDFYKIYNIFSTVTNYRETSNFNEYQKKALEFLLSQFVAFTLESRAGNDIYKDLFGCSDEEDVIPENDDKPDYMNKYSDEIFEAHNASKAIIVWILNNIFNNEELESYIREIIKRYTPNQKSALDLFLTTNSLSLEWTTFTEGYMDALSNAYDGKLTSEQLLDFLVIIKQTRTDGIQLPEEPDYDRMEQAYDTDNRINEQEPILGGSDGRVDDEAVNLRKKIKRFIATRQIKKKNIEYYDQCLAYFKEPENNQLPYFTTNTSISIDLDNQLIDTILATYENTSNKNRINISRSFSAIRFSVQNPDEDESVRKFIQKLSLLEEKIIEDQIAKVNLQKFIAKVREKFVIN